MIEWDVQKGKAQCDACKVGFLDGQPCHCLLQLDADPLLRQDYCQGCWTKDVANALAGSKEYATWVARYKIIVPVPKEEIVKRDHAEIVFRKLLASGDPSKKNIIFVLAVMLERKKILKQQKVTRNASEESGGGERKNLVYVHADTTESIVIEDPQIRLSEWGRIQKEVKNLLEEELALLSSSPISG